MQNNNKHSRNKPTKEDYEGVVYEPSQNVEKYKNNSDSVPSRKVPAKRKVSLNQKSQFNKFHMITLCTGVIICVTVFTIVFSSVDKGRKPTSSKGQNEVLSTPPPISEMSSRNLKEFSAIIKKLSFGENVVTVFDIENAKDYSFPVTMETLIEDKYGETLIFSELKVGDMVKIKFNVETNALAKIFINTDPSVWEHKVIKDVKFQHEYNTVIIGNKIATYNEDTIVKYRDLTYDIKKLSSKDILTIKGYKDKVSFIEVEKSHGSIEILNADKVKNGYIEINTDSFFSLEDIKKYDLAEGSHKLVIKGENIEPYTKTIDIKESQTIEIDLGNAKFKTSTLLLTISPGDSLVKIDGTEVANEEPIILDFGEHTIKVTKEGYIPWLQTVNLQEPNRELKIELKEEVSTCELTIKTIPEGANIFVDNAYIGDSPITSLIDYGARKITAKKDGYNDMTVNLEISEPVKGYELMMHKKTVQDPVLTTPLPIISSTTPVPTLTPSPTSTITPIITVPTSEAESQTENNEQNENTTTEGGVINFSQSDNLR